MNKKRLTILILSVLVFFGFILFTSPYHLPLLLIIVPGVTFIMAVHILLAFLVKNVSDRAHVRRLIVNVLTIILSVVAVLVSVGQFTFRDFSLLLALALLGMFYISRILEK